MNKTLLFFITAITCIGTYWLTRNPIQSDTTTTLVIGTVGDYAPWVSVNEQGEYEGFDIDVARALANQLGKKLEIKDLGSMTSLFVALEQGSIDAIIWGLSITQERLEKVAMIRYQGDTITSYPLLFWQSIPASVQSITDMNGMTICVEPASSQESVLRKYPNVIIKPIDRVDDALLNIQYGKADAALVEQAIAHKFKRIYPEICILNVPLAPEDQVYGVGITIKQDNTSLIRLVEKAVTALIQNGTIAEYEKTWGIS